jgi:hypothetical protein
MTARRDAQAARRYEKSYPSAAAADRALCRSLAARRAGVQTPAVLDRVGPMQLSFARIAAGAPPGLAEMIGVLPTLNRMPKDGLSRFDAFLRIRPRLGAAPPEVRNLAAALEAQDAALGWPSASVIHGDFHPGQTMRDRSGTVWLLDLDDLALAPPEADLGNLAAWIATRSQGVLEMRAKGALAEVSALAPGADAGLTRHFLRIALVRRSLKLAEKGVPWALDQLALRSRDIVLLDPVTESVAADPKQSCSARLVAMRGGQGFR